MSSTPSSRDASPKAASRPISDGALDASPKSGQRQFLVALGGLLSLAAAIGIGRFVYTPILPYMVESLGLSNAQGGLLASANFLGYLAGAIAASSSLLHGGPRSWLLSGLALSALTTVAMGVTSTVGWWVLLRFAGGVASAFVLVFASALVLDRLAAAGRADLAGLHFAGVGAGIAVSAVVVSSLAALGQDWRMLWIASGFSRCWRWRRWPA
jgi:MFS family permease